MVGKPRPKRPKWLEDEVDAYRKAVKPQGQVVIRITPNPYFRPDVPPSETAWTLRWMVPRLPVAFHRLPARGTFKKVGKHFLVLEG